MSTASTTPQPLATQDLADIQGVIIRGYNLPSMRHFVVTIGQASAAKELIGHLISGDGSLSITTAAQWPANTKPDYALNIGFSAKGLQALRLPDSVNFGSVPYGNFAEFLEGAVSRATVVGDVGTSAPKNWVPKLAPGQADDAHMLISLYAESPDVRDERSNTLRSLLADVVPASGPGSDTLEWDVDAMLVTLPDGRVQHKIHFGYTDGISNPKIAVEGQPPLRPNELPYVMPWRFVTREDSPQYTPPEPPHFGLNGSFTAFRILEQNVEAFEAFLASEGRDSDQQEFLASKLCGRWRNGNPVVEAPDKPGDVLSDDQLTDFDYGTDQVGEPCPYSSHTRRTNPRGGPGVQGVNDKTSFRIMRRANPYGPAWTGKADGKSRGLAGHFICASFANQFEFIMRTWVNVGEFSASPPVGLDPLLANVPADSSFPYRKDGDLVEVPGLDKFVTTRGGLYCFLPSMTSLSWIAAQPDCKTGACFTVPPAS